MKKSKPTQNTTLLRLKNTPFSSAGDMKAQEDRILREEWETIERAKQRRRLLKKEENADVVAPFTNGFGARFVGSMPKENLANLVRVYLTPNDQLQIDIDEKLNTKDATDTVTCLVKSISESFMNSYLTALGLKDESLFPQSSASSKD